MCLPILIHMKHEEIVKREELLEQKRMKIRGIVSLIDPTPDIRFWQISCPESKADELVHYHSKTHTVCVSELDLRELSIEEIEKQTKGEFEKWKKKQ